MGKNSNQITMPEIRSLSVSGTLRALLKTNPKANVNDALVAVWEAQEIKFTDDQKLLIRQAHKYSGICATFRKIKKEAR
jgi:hypothetical protein